MRVFENRDFANFLDRSSAATFENLVFRNCTFVNCDISIATPPECRTTVRNVEAVNCEVLAGFGGSTAIFEEIVVSGLKTGGVLRTCGAVFRHVALKGRIGRLMLHNTRYPDRFGRTIRGLAAANAAYYQSSDWALDISEGRFVDLDIRGVPGDLIRRDPETAVIVRRENTIGRDWRRLNVGRSDWVLSSIEFMVNAGEKDVVLVARTASPKMAREDLRALDVLRREGVADPD